MNEDFYYFFSLFKDNCVFNEALNTARYRYGLDPERYLNLYSDIVNDPGNTHLIEDELSMFFNIDVLSHNEYVLLPILKNIIVDSRKIICGKDSDKLYCSLPRKTQKTDKQNTKKSAREKTSWRI